MQEKCEDCKKNGHKNVTEMQNRRDRIPNQWTKPDGIRDNERCSPIANRDNAKKRGQMAKNTVLCIFGVVFCEKMKKKFAHVANSS